MTQATKTAPVDRPVFGRRDPDARGYFGAYGGRFVPETLVAPIEELTAGYYAARKDEAFCEELDRLLKHYVGRPTPLYEARNLTGEAGRAGGGGGGARGFLQRGGFCAHRAGQNHQHPRPGAARPPEG